MCSSCGSPIDGQLMCSSWPPQKTCPSVEGDTSDTQQGELSCLSYVVSVVPYTWDMNVSWLSFLHHHRYTKESAFIGKSMHSQTTGSWQSGSQLQRIRKPDWSEGMGELGPPIPPSTHSTRHAYSLLFQISLTQTKRTASDLRAALSLLIFAERHDAWKDSSDFTRHPTFRAMFTEVLYVPETLRDTEHQFVSTTDFTHLMSRLRTFVQAGELQIIS